MNNAKSEKDQDIAVRCFMNLLRWLRIVLLQDSVFLRMKYPTLEIWREFPFDDPLFDTFAAELLHEADHGETPQYVRISKAMPDLAHQLQEQQGNLMTTMSTYHQSILAENKQEHAATTDSNRREHALTRELIHHNMQPMLSLLTDLSNPGIIFQTSSETRVQLANSSHGIANINISPIGPMMRHEESMAAMATAATATAATAMAVTTTTMDPIIEQYRLAAHVTTVINLWREYTVGIPPRAGASPGPSIRQLDRDFRGKWRTDDNCRKAYSRRRHIWEAIIQASNNLKQPPEIIAEKVDRWCQNQGFSLNRLNSILAAAHKKDSRQSGIWGNNDVDLLSVV